MARRNATTKARVVADELETADALVASIEQLRAAHSGTVQEFCAALYAAYEAVEAYRQVRVEQAAGAES